MSNIAKTQFQCNPQKYCKQALCCKTKESVPFLSPGDFIRIGNFTGISPLEIWQKHGSVKISHFSRLPEFTYQVSLSLYHDPCPYLNERGFGCDTYEARPVICEVSPYNLLMKGNAGSVDDAYACLKNKFASPDQLDHASKLLKIMDRESRFAEKVLSMAYFFQNFHPIKVYPELAKIAAGLMSIRDPFLQSKIGNALSDSLTQVLKIIERVNQGESLELNPYDYAELLVPVIHTIIYDDVCDFFGNLRSDVLEFYSKSTRERETLSF